MYSFQHQSKYRVNLIQLHRFTQIKQQLISVQKISMNTSNSQIHESIIDSQSQSQPKKASDPQFILHSEAYPIRMIETKKSSNELDLSKTGKPKYTPNTQPKSMTYSQPKPSFQRPQTATTNQPSPSPALDMTNYTRQQQKPSVQNLQSRNQNIPIRNSNEGAQSKNIHVVDQGGQPFIQYYEENIKLKRRQQELTRQVSQLRNQLDEQSQVRNRNNERQLMDLAAGRKNLWDTTKEPVPTGWKNKNKSTMPRDPKDSNKVGHLLQIIDHYKQKLMVAEEQIQNLKRQKHLLQQDGKLKQKKNDQLLKSFQGPSNKTNSAELEQQLRNVTKLFEIEKQRNRFNEADIRRLETKIQTLEINKQQLNEMRMENRNLEEKLLRLTSLPSFSAITDKVEEEGRFKKMEDKYNDLKEKYDKYKKEFIKNQAELKLIRNQLIKANIEADQLSKQNFKLNQQLHDNPIISKLLQDHELLKEVVYEIQKKKNSSQFQSELERQNYDKILMEKQALANELTVVRTKMAALQENWKERERISKIQRDELVNTFKTQSNVKAEGKVMSKNGVAYSDDVSMFTQDTQNISPSSNYFDIFLGELHLLETMMATNFNIRNVDNTLILATVDFYNHNTETTRPVHGTNCNMQSQFSFKVSEDEFFFKYLNKGTFSIEIWGSEGNKRIQLGKAVIDLRPLVLKSKKNIAPVASSSAPIYMNQKVMGSINFVMRLRLPVFEQLQKVNQIQQIVGSEDAPLRKLIIQIQEGRGFSQKSNTFVYFPFRLEDYYTKTFKGTNPNWNYNKAIEVRYNNDIKNYLRKNQLQLVVLDDNAVIAHEGDTDVVGTAYVSLVPLIENRPIKDRVPVMKGTQRVGHLDIRIFWFDNQSIDTGIDKKVALKTTSQLVSAFLTSNRLTPDQLFDRIDTNKTGAVSYEEFLVWIPKISSQINVDMAAIYYSQFRQPLNKINFEARLNADMGKKSDDIIKQFSEINKMMLQNTQVITKKQSLREYLKGKDAYSVCLEIDKSLDGRVSKKQLQKFFDVHNIEPPVDSIGKEEVNIVELIQQYQKMQ